MPREIERKFLIRREFWQQPATGEHILQGYLTRDGQPVSVRVRIAGDRAWLNLKSPLSDIIRAEYEYEIPLADARELLADYGGGLVEKIRYRIDYQGKIWEVDKFLGLNAGLLVAEIELASPEEEFLLPPWAGEEVSSRPNYLNTYLAEHPFSTWDK